MPTYTSANNYLKYGFMNSFFLQDFSNSIYPEGHPFVYTHMPPGPDIFFALLLSVSKGSYQIVRVIIVLLIIVGMYFYYSFAKLVLSGLNIKINAAGYAIALIGPWTLIRLMESQIYPLLPFLAFFPIFSLQKYLETNRKIWLFLFVFVSFLSSIYIEYSLLTGIIFCYIFLFLMQLVSFEKKYLLIYLYSIAGGIILHMFQNLMYFGPSLFVKELTFLLRNRITGYPTQAELFDFYQSLGVVHHGARPIDLRTLFLQIEASLHLNPEGGIIYLTLLLSSCLCLLWNIISDTDKSPTFRNINPSISNSLKYFGRLLIWVGMTVLSPIFVFPAFAQEVNIASFGGNFFFSIFIVAVVFFSVEQVIGVFYILYKRIFRILVRNNYFRNSIPANFFAVSFRKRSKTSIIAHRKPFFQWLLVVFFVVLLWFDIRHVSKIVLNLFRFTIDEVGYVLDFQEITPPEINLDSSLVDLQRFGGYLFMTNINSPTVGFLVNYPGYGVCGPDSVSENGEIKKELCSIEFIKSEDIVTRRQQPRYFFYFTYPSLFPGFADCMPPNTMVGARGGDQCMSLMERNLSSNYNIIFQNDVVMVFDLQQKMPVP